MTRRRRPRPTDAELSILQILWACGPCTVRQVHDQLGRKRSVGYTTVLKFLQIMTDKGLVRRDASDRSHVYRPAVSQHHTQRRLVKEVLDKAFGGSAAELVAQALAAGKASPNELKEIRKLLDELERGNK